jgi:predicted RNA-binding Zn-ribbon protein involved in translation (DUF1610 family)
MSQSFPPPNYVAVPSAIEGIAVFKPAPDDAGTHQETVDFACPQCGGITAFSATDGGLTCTSCGYFEPPQAEVVGKAADKFEFTVETLSRPAHGWGEVRKELQCQGCGAYTSLPTNSLTHTCPFCGSNKVIQRDAPQDVLRPRYLIPFKIEPDACHVAAREWMGSSWMTPGALRRLAKVAEFSGIYLPFWTFDAVTQASWRAQVGHTKRYTDSKGRSRTRTVWKWESGHVQLGHNDLLIAGTSKVSHILINRIRTVNLHELAPYEPTYLAGLQAQAYDIPLEQSWETARQEMRETTRLACRDQASTGKIRNFTMEMDFSDEHWRYILLPFYLANYSYEDEAFQVMVNGQSGDVSGQRPVDWFKVWLAIAALLAPGLTLGVIGFITLLLGGIGIFVLIVAFVILILGLGFGFRLFTKAQEMDDA